MSSRARYYVALFLAVVLLTGCSSGGLPSAPTVSPTTAPTRPPQPTVTGKSKATSTAKPVGSSTPRAPRATATRGKSPSQPTKGPTQTPTSILEAETATPEESLPTETAETGLVTTPTEAAEPDQSSTPEATDFVFVDQSNYTDLDGNAVVVGLIQYRGSIAIGAVEIAVELEDADRALLSTQSADTVPDLVQPGGYIPFKAVFLNPPDNFEYYNTTVQGDEVDQAILALYTDNFEIMQVSLIKSDDPYTPRLVGRVKNTGSTSVEYTEVIAALLNDEGNVLDVSSGFTSLTSIDAGQQSAFEIFFDNGEGGAKYEIVATALVGN